MNEDSEKPLIVLENKPLVILNAEALFEYFVL